MAKEKLHSVAADSSIGVSVEHFLMIVSGY